MKFKYSNGADDQIINMFETLNENIKNQGYDETKIEEYIQDMNM